MVTNRSMTGIFSLALVLLFVVYTQKHVLEEVSFSDSMDDLSARRELLNTLRSPPYQKVQLNPTVSRNNFPNRNLELSFPDLVLTSIDVRPVNGNKVRFSGAITSNVTDETAVLLKNIVDTGLKEGNPRQPIYEAELVDVNEIKALTGGKEIFFYIHGFTVEPYGNFKTFNRVKNKFSNYVLALVIWPTATRNNLNTNRLYKQDRLVSRGAGKALATVFQNPVFRDIPMSVMCHSMGNRVLRYISDENHDKNIGIKFGDIYMIAADVEDDTFEKYTGKKITKMLRDGGKVHVAYRKDDLALKASARVNGKFLNPNERLGIEGVVISKLYDGDVKSKVVNVKMNGYPVADSDNINHYYHFQPYMIWYYEATYRHVVSETSTSLKTEHLKNVKE